MVRVGSEQVRPQRGPYSKLLILSFSSPLTNTVSLLTVVDYRSQTDTFRPTSSRSDSDPTQRYGTGYQDWVYRQSRYPQPRHDDWTYRHEALHPRPTYDDEWYYRYYAHQPSPVYDYWSYRSVPRTQYAYDDADYRYPVQPAPSPLLPTETPQPPQLPQASQPVRKRPSRSHGHWVETRVPPKPQHVPRMYTLQVLRARFC
ncbi:hypothetical protein K491DRAFT_477807 [Lophiostoma macrostomum CBS 122681]|uniref:Uncharacterized protein n=1 Tax=Lophiostoma macrostomum CBS 122681 TaxID=1314788 RepID=A0A6A6TPM8_9PLEO|nr:hypothetical protein K491DRAFT_477807 [Lophiostoma macrostomum CBS 122681]